MSRPWLALVLALFCLPLFVDLGRADLENDEAIYSFAVDRILETGRWLEPKSSPNEDDAFLEKPPLKFWIVAAPIKAGLLPHDEFGLRFWDAVFAAAAFLYVFAIGCRLISPVCGAVAVLLLFVHRPLLFHHGLRTNSLESALLLSYCGSVYHFLGWAGEDRARARRLHGLAGGLYFVLGFMTKFVAVAFLPLVLGAASLIAPAYRAKVVRDWRLWGAVGLLALALCAPWFVWAHVRYGAFFWKTILSESVEGRSTTVLNPVHVQPWYFYALTMYRRFGDTGASGLVVAGLLVLAVQTVRRRWAEGLVVVLWFALPIVLISSGTSKLYHYAYPFVPPLALGGGYLAAIVIALARAPFARALQRLDDAVTALAPRAAAARRRSAVWSLLASKSARWAVPLVVASLLPLPGYRQSLSRMSVPEHPLRDARDCLQSVQTRDVGGAESGLFVDLPDEAVSHPLYYYFRRVRPWTRTETTSPAALDRYLFNPAEARPVLIWKPRYQEFMRRSEHALTPPGARPAVPPMATFNDVLLLLPGPYAQCSVEAPGLRERR